MTGELLELEFLELDMPDADAMAWLRRRVPHSCLIDRRHLVKAAQIEILPSGCFEFSDSGDRAFVLPVRDEWEDVIDLAAWRPSQPEVLHPLIGAAVCLGEGVIDNPATYWAGDALRVFRSPLGWLAAGGQGAVIINRDRAWRRFLDVPKLAAEDEAHSRELARLLRPRIAPSIAIERLAA